MRHAVVFASLLAFGSAFALPQGLALAQNVDVIKKRQEHFKAMGGAAKPMGQMLRGEADFDLAKVQASLKTIKDNALPVSKLFPEDTKTGGETHALPAIWESKDKFDALFVKLDADVTAAIPAVKDQASFKAEVPKVLGNCGACHKEFVKKKE